MDIKRLRVIIDGINNLSPALKRAEAELAAFQRKVDQTNARVREGAGTTQFAKAFKEAQQSARSFQDELRKAYQLESLAHRERLRRIDDEERAQKQAIERTKALAINAAQRVAFEKEVHEEKAHKDAIQRIFEERDARFAAIRDARGGINPRSSATRIPSLAEQNGIGSFVSKDEAIRAVAQETNTKLLLTDKYFNELRDRRDKDYTHAITLANNENANALRLLRQRLDATRREVRAAVPTEASVLRGLLRDRSAAIGSLDNIFKRTGARAGTFFSDMRRGFQSTGEGARRMSKDVLQAESSFFRFGRRIGGIINDVNRLINLRWFLLVSFFQVLGTLATNLVAALVMLASSAIEAGAALGGALVAGAGQAAAAFGILYLALIRIQKVFSIVQLAQKQQIRDSRDAEAQADAEKQAKQRLADATETVRDAQVRLAKARKQAARDLVDANLDERDSALSLREAELGVLEAKERLRKEREKERQDKSDLENARAAVREAQARLDLARAQGDTVQAGIAAQQLSVAKNNVQSIIDNADNSGLDLAGAKLGVQRADLTLDQARVRNARQQRDSAEVKRKGIKNNDEVIDSTKALTKALREVVDAREAVVKAAKKETNAQATLKEQLADLSPAERRLFYATNNLVNQFKKKFRPVTDIIVDAFARAIRKITTLFDDPRLIKASTKIATAIAGSIDKIADFLVSEKFRKAFIFFADNAAKNIPKLTNAFLDLLDVLIKIGKAGTPLFNNIVDGTEKIIGRFDKWAGRRRGTGPGGRPEEGTRGATGTGTGQTNIEHFLGQAEKHLKAWYDLSKAIGRVLTLLISGSAVEGKGLLGSITDALNKLADWMQKNPEKVRAFFKRMHDSINALAKTLTGVGGILFKLFTSKESEAFTKLILETLIPAFALFIKVAGSLSRVLVAIFGAGSLGAIAKYVAEFGLMYGIFRKLFPFLPKLRSLFSYGDDALKAAHHTREAVENFRRFQTMVKAGTPAMQALSGTFPNLAKGIRFVGTALKFVFITNPWIAIVLGLITAVVLLDRKFHFIAPTIRAIRRASEWVFNWIKQNWKLLGAIILAPFVTIPYLIIKYRDKIIDFFKFIINWVRDNWKSLIVAYFTAPFKIGGIIWNAIKGWRDKVVDLFKELPGLIGKALSSLPGIILGVLKRIPGAKYLGKIGGKVGGLFKSVFGGGKDDNKNVVTPEDAVVALSLYRPKLVDTLRAKKLSNKEIVAYMLKNKLITKARFEDIAGGKIQGFKLGGEVQGGLGEAVPIIAHAGEWVLNKSQQMKLAQKLGIGTQQLQASIFGTNIGSNKPKGKDPRQEYAGGTFNLTSEKDEFDNRVYFIQLADGTYGQVTKKDATKIQDSKGLYIPKYVRRSSHGFKQRMQKAIEFRNFGAGVHKFALGGVVPGRYSNFTTATNLNQPSGHRQINQHFNVTTQGETDWNYVMRLGAIHAMQGA